MAYEKVYASEREGALSSNPFEGYEQLAVGEGVTDEDALKKLAEGLVGHYQPWAILLWNPESGEVYVNYGRFGNFGERQGYQQHEAGFVRYEAQYVLVSSRGPYKEVKGDYRQNWEVGRVEQYDEISEPNSSEHPSHDPKLSGEVEGAIRDALLDDMNTTTVGMDSEDWMVTNGPNTNLLFSELDPNQRWVAFRIRREGRELEEMAQRIGLNCRVYRNGANLLAHGYHGNFHDIWPDNELILVPVGVKVG